MVRGTFETPGECRVASGRWRDPYTGLSEDVPNAVDIDYLVPLENIHYSGGWRWPADRKREYANYLGDTEHLIAVTMGANRSKGERGPEEWRPPDESYWCLYATNWVEVKAEWGLTMTEPEAEAIMEMLDTCENPPEVEFLDLMETRTGVHKPEYSSSMYGSCEEAEEAGEQRIQGSGGGRGSPKAMVPDAHDGKDVVGKRQVDTMLTFEHGRSLSKALNSAGKQKFRQGRIPNDA